jgi:hypothetical protein
MDCISTLLQNLYEKKFHCAKTKCEAIIKHSFFHFAQERLQQNLAHAKYVTLLSDTSNYRATKLYLVRYFNFDSGANIKTLDLDDICGETSNILSNHTYSKLHIDKYALNDKIIALFADNTNTNFGRVQSIKPGCSTCSVFFFIKLIINSYFYIKCAKRVFFVHEKVFYAETKVEAI